MVSALYLLSGLVWTYFIDKYSSTTLGLEPMKSVEIFFQLFFWPIGFCIFSFTFLKEVFSKKN